MKNQARWITVVLLVLGALQFVGGLMMLFAPAAWYAGVPGVPETGPLNSHLVMDGGTFNIPIGLALMIAASDAHRHVLAIAVAAGAAILHSLLHVWSHAAGVLSLEHLTTEIIGIYIPAAIVTYVAIAAAAQPRRSAASMRAAAEGRS